MITYDPPIDYNQLALTIKKWGQELGFQQVGITDIDLIKAESKLLAWLERGFHGEMGYMAQHGTKRSRPQELHAGTIRIICVRMNYLTAPPEHARLVRDKTSNGYISRYAIGRDYHKLLRKRIQQLANKISEAVGPFGHRAFVDSAPVLERPLAAKAGLGWQGKHSNLLSRDAGSWFFLGELYTDLPLPIDPPATDHCGKCTDCIDACPTQAIVAPYQVDARRCISYLTIELKGAIPVEFRTPIGNRIFGCDDCQLACPWSRFAQITEESDFNPRHGLDSEQLINLFNWSEETFLKRTEGMPIRRIGHEQWLRNIAIGLGNGPDSPEAINALKSQLTHPSAIVREHVEWALLQLENSHSTAAD
ncbi:MAG: tRNA epoxyqueuosine(34) reductase QueG [Candidatus Polarisedimenticolaceae bacterium]|nr:tRNA epoxyqueuosine(34) reductase QueG [Candidatus Polarisedimenticolaceae bacterium]